MCIATNGSTIVPLSAEDICFCSSWNGCNGGDISTPWEWISHYGAVSGGQYNGTGPYADDGLCSSYSLIHCHHHGPLHGDPYPSEGTAGCPKQRSAICPKKCDAGVSRTFEDDKMVFDGELQAIACFTHGVNFAVMMADAYASGFPVLLAHALYFMIYAALYLCWTFVHYQSGVGNEKGEPYIYSAVNWAHPDAVKALAVSRIFHTLRSIWPA